jgi:hypothetical protein
MLNRVQEIEAIHQSMVDAQEIVSRLEDGLDKYFLAIATERFLLWEALGRDDEALNRCSEAGYGRPNDEINSRFD